MAQLLSNLPNGALLKFGKHQVGSETAQPIVWMVVDKNHSGYPSNSVTLITQRIIDLRAYDAKELDDEGKSKSGNPNYNLSNIHQWLNSASGAGNWYTPTHSYDTPPTRTNTSYNAEYDGRAGFLYNFTASERISMLPTTLVLPKDDTTSSSIVTNVFLPSVGELLGTKDGTTRFAHLASIGTIVGVTSQVVTNSSASTKPSSTEDGWVYWTRNNYSNAVGVIAYDGDFSYGDEEKGNVGVRPCINLSKNAIVSDSTDSDGCYTVIFNNSPVISGTNSDLGIKGNAFSQTYTVADADNNNVTVTEYLDNVKVRSYVASLDATNTFAITGNTWYKLANGIHTMKIVATDGFDEVARTFTFTKSVTKLVAQRATPFDSTTQPKSILATVVKVIPDGAIFKVEACNNGYDASPTWEDITTRVNQGRVYDFTNTVKTAGKWGVNIRVTVDRNGKEGACYITEIGGNFE